MYCMLCTACYTLRQRETTRIIVSTSICAVHLQCICGSHSWLGFVVATGKMSCNSVL
ncbi:hypothetical protein BDV10DRAFT_169935, partial [Aspergillus recurvatus]